MLILSLGYSLCSGYHRYGLSLCLGSRLGFGLSSNLSLMLKLGLGLMMSLGTLNALNRIFVISRLTCCEEISSFRVGCLLEMLRELRLLAGLGISAADARL